MHGTKERRNTLREESRNYGFTERRSALGAELRKDGAKEI